MGARGVMSAQEVGRAAELDRDAPAWQLETRIDEGGEHGITALRGLAPVSAQDREMYGDLRVRGKETKHLRKMLRLFVA